MKFIVCENYEQMSQKAAEIFASQLILKPDSILGLATGTTPIGTYDRLVEMNKEGKKTTSGKVITRLKDKNVWYRDTETSDPNKKSTQRQTEAVYYQRDFINKWLKNEWIEKDELRGSYILTEKGRIVIDTFYV